MKKQFIIFGIIAATILVTAVFASNIERLTAYVAQFRVFVNGEEQNFENPVVVIDGRTYIPLREVSEVLGIDVRWFEENQTIILQNTQNRDEISGFFLESFWQSELGYFNSPLDGLWGFKDADGNIIIEPQFRGFAITSSPFRYGISRIVLEQSDGGGHRRHFYIDKSGDILFDGMEFWWATDFSEGFARVSNQTHGGLLDEYQGAYVRTAFINTNGEFMTDFEFESTMPFRNGLAMVRKDGKWGLINRNFEVVIDFLYEDFRDLEDFID